MLVARRSPCSSTGALGDLPTSTPTLRSTIAAAIADKRLSQAATARAAAMHRHQLCRYLSGQCDLTGATLDRLLAALGIMLTRAGK